MAKKKKKVRRAVRGLASVSLGALQAELNRRMERLQARRDELTTELEALDAELGGFEAPAPRRRARRPAKKKAKKRGRPAKKRVIRRKVKRKKTARRGRPRNQMSLVAALQKLLTNKTLSVTDMAGAVQKAGYKTSSPNFRTIVNQTLINNPSMFKRVARGQYTAK